MSISVILRYTSQRRGCAAPHLLERGASRRRCALSACARLADARGKCKYVKARPEFSYSRCPPQYTPRHLLFSLLALTRCNRSSTSHRPQVHDPFHACVASTCALDNIYAYTIHICIVHALQAHVRDRDTLRTNAYVIYTYIRLTPSPREHKNSESSRNESDSLSSSISFRRVVDFSPCHFYRGKGKGASPLDRSHQSIATRSSCKKGSPIEIEKVALLRLRGTEEIVTFVFFLSYHSDILFVSLCHACKDIRERERPAGKKITVTDPSKLFHRQSRMCIFLSCTLTYSRFHMEINASRSTEKV